MAGITALSVDAPGDYLDADIAFQEIIAPYARHPAAQQMKCYIQHGTTTTYDHCMSVAHTCYKLACTLKLRVNMENLVTGAFLHDLYLYDWHDRTTSKPHHATKHPVYAHENALKYFEINPVVENIILSHMWPLPPTRLPKSKEAVLVTIVDKWCSLGETCKRFGRRLQR
ncbi:MAG: HD domain-containing protein [Coriobacteriales bacterium]|nr:HD domain-containing protein [Coriobacteriales bacterium]